MFCECNKTLFWEFMQRPDTKNTKQKFDFFINYFAAPRSTFGRWRRCSLTYPMLITQHIWFDLKVTGSLVTRLGPKAQLNASVRLEPGTSNSELMHYPTNVTDTLD